jgi:3-oxoacyl-[acyl-carrier protein] reductase
MNPTPKMDGEFALVTGGSRGIGRAIASALAGAGCNVALASRSIDEVTAAAADIGRRTGVRTLAECCDVSDRASVCALFQQFRRWASGRLDVLVCNAGFPYRLEIFETPLDATPPDQLEAWYLEVFRTDTLGSVFCTYEALPLMLARQRGSIIYISSIPALAGSRGTPYTIAKAGILGLMKDVAREYGKYNIRANALALGNIQTPATFEHLDAETQQAFADEAPLRRWGQPEEVGQTALFLASTSSSYITGQTLVVDGGIVRQ